MVILEMCVSYVHWEGEGGKCRSVRTVPTKPAETRRKLKVCCVPRAAFSPVLRSAQLYRPSSLVTVIARLLLDVGPELELVLAWRVLWLICGPRCSCLRFRTDTVTGPERMESLDAHDPVVVLGPKVVRVCVRHACWKARALLAMFCLTVELAWALECR